MIRGVGVWFIGAFSVLSVGCYGGPSERPLPQPIEESADVVVPSVEAGVQAGEVGVTRQAWAEATHVRLSELAALKWALPSSRVGVIGDAGDDPDEFESGFDNGFNQQWSHAYIYSSLGFWIWGDANENFDDCITGRLAGQIEGPECKDGKSAREFYDSGNQLVGDRYLGYATHYIEDVCQVLHASSPSVDMLTHHFDYEAWVQNNWTAGYNLSQAVMADNYYYPITDLQQAVRNAAWAASYWNSQSYGRTAWNAYRAASYPTAAGTGSAELASSTTQLLIRASRYATGAVKYTLDRYQQWNSTY